jgi:hypothetical protein
MLRVNAIHPLVDSPGSLSTKSTMTPRHEDGIGTVAARATDSIAMAATADP